MASLLHEPIRPHQPAQQQPTLLPSFPCNSPAPLRSKRGTPSEAGLSSIGHAGGAALQLSCSCNHLWLELLDCLVARSNKGRLMNATPRLQMVGIKLEEGLGWQGFLHHGQAWLGMALQVIGISSSRLLSSSPDLS